MEDLRRRSTSSRLKASNPSSERRHHMNERRAEREAPRVRDDVEGHVLEQVEEADVEGHRFASRVEQVEDTDVEGHMFEQVEQVEQSRIASTFTARKRAPGRAPFSLLEHVLERVEQRERLLARAPPPARRAPRRGGRRRRRRRCPCSSAAFARRERWSRSSAIAAWFANSPSSSISWSEKPGRCGRSSTWSTPSARSSTSSGTDMIPFGT